MSASREPRTVLIVGATGRLGVEIARKLMARGDRVVLTARDPGRLANLAGELSQLAPDGGEPTWSCVDLRDDDAPERIAREAREAGGIDDVVLACGPFPRTPLDDLKREDLEFTLRVHAVAPLLLVNELADDLRRNEGAVVGLVDSGVSRPFPNHVAYLTAKGALMTGIRALAVELAPHVRLNAVALGIVADPEADADPLRTHRLAARSSLGRFGTPRDVAHAVLSLLDATWSTGEVWGIGR